MKTIALIMAMIVLLCGCSQENDFRKLEEDLSAVETGTEENLIRESGGEETIEIELLETMDMTNIIYLEPLNDEIIYIIGAKRDNSFERREIVYGFCNVKEKEVFVFHREFTSIDGAQNTSVYMDEDGSVKFFTGRKIYTLKGKEILSSISIEDWKYGYETFVDLKGMDIAFVDGEQPTLYLKRQDGSVAEISRYETEINEEGKEYTLFPFSPKVKNEKILYGIAAHDTTHYKKIMISDAEGNVISETNDLDTRADHVFFYWKDEGFITIETADYLSDGTQKEHTIFAEYDETSQIVKEEVVSGMCLVGQRKMYDGSSLYAYSYKDGEHFSLAIYDFDTNASYIFCEIEGYIASPTITPSGEYVVWANNGILFREKIENLESKEMLEEVQ